MASVNKVILIGNLGRDPEIRSSRNGGKVGTISIATTEFRKDAKTGKSSEQTQWHRISIFGKLLDVAEQFLKKGSSVFIEGRIRTSKCIDKAGVERYGIEIVCENLQLIGTRTWFNHESGTEVKIPYDELSSGVSANFNSYDSNQFDKDTIPF